MNDVEFCLRLVVFIKTDKTELYVPSLSYLIYLKCAPSLSYFNLNGMNWSCHVVHLLADYYYTEEFIT